MKAWRHRDGGFVLQLFGRKWLLEVSFARRRLAGAGSTTREPFRVSLTTGYRDE